MPASSSSPASTAGSASPASPPVGGAGAASASHSTALQPSSTLLREHQEEFERLRMGSFNQALRINFLEERLLRYKNGTAFESEDLENELFQLRLALQDREQELKRKSLTIVRATEYMKELQDQLRDAGAELERLRAAPSAAPRVRHRRGSDDAGDSDSDSAAQLRVELQHALEREQSLRARLAALEDELGSHQDTVASVTAQHHELLQTHAATAMEIEQWRARLAQRDEEAARWQEQRAKLEREKEHAEARHQSKLARMEEQVQAQLAQLERESKTYRAEHAQLVADREQARFERERSALAADAAKQETARVQAEIERLAAALEAATRDADAQRLQAVKLAATCEHKTQTLDEYKAERESAMQSLQKLEAELRQWRSACADRDVSLKSAERRAQLAEDEAARVATQLERATSLSQQSAHERMQSLESERLATQQENARLRKDLAARQHELEALAARFESVDQQLAEETTRARELTARCAATETELAHRTRQLAQSEQREADAALQASSSEAASRQEQDEVAERLAAEKRELLQALHEEQEHADAMERNAGAIEKANALLVAQLEAVARELCVIAGRDAASSVAGDPYEGIVSQLRDAIKSVEREFEAEAAALERTWRQHTERVEKQLEQLTHQLCASEGKLAVLQRTTVHVSVDKKESERSWSTRYEKLREEKESERRGLEVELRDAQAAALRAEAALSQTKRELEALARANEGARADAERNYDDLKESNRLLHDEVRECRRALAHARKQHVRAIAENKDLLSAVDVYKSAAAAREQDVEHYKAALMARAQQLQRRVSFSDVKQTLLEQLEHTQYMINETYKRWSVSELGGGGGSGSAGGLLPGAGDLDAAVVGHLDEYIGRMEIVTERWHELVSQSRELHRRYGDAWRRATLSADRPVWVDTVERKASRLLNESVRVSETLRDVVENVAGVIQRERNERKAFRDERLAAAAAGGASTKPMPTDASKPSAAAWLDALDARSNQRQPHDVDVSKPRGARRVPVALHRSSLSSLGRIDSELQDIEKKIRSYQE
ncbi:hypothetical protein PybrP1_012288 [[Pythium] brassicae (nom. inval.)]|nr:hypothetical protein PybrP1_012288 [[Pythium] brassicae (nom. inval.)]